MTPLPSPGLCWLWNFSAFTISLQVSIFYTERLKYSTYRLTSVDESFFFHMKNVNNKSGNAGGKKDEPWFYDDISGSGWNYRSWGVKLRRKLTRKQAKAAKFAITSIPN